MDPDPVGQTIGDEWELIEGHAFAQPGVRITSVEPLHALEPAIIASAEAAVAARKA